jgi:hypothetical protein
VRLGPLALPRHRPGDAADTDGPRVRRHRRGGRQRATSDRAAGLSLAEAAGESMGGHEAALFLAGSVSSAVVGYLAVRFLIRFLAHHSLRVFAYYRFVLAAVVAAALLYSG